MKPTIAIVQGLQVSAADIDMARQHIVVELAGERDDNRIAERHEKQAAAARESAKARRLRIGQQLAKVRPAWPERGPKAKGWGDFLRQVGISEDSALRYMAEARGDVFPQKPSTAGNLDGDARPSTPPLMLTPDSTTANVHGGSGERRRGSYCTPEKYARAVGSWDLDPFSNPQSHIEASIRCMLENGGDGFGGSDEPGCYRSGRDLTGIADDTTRVWLQPDYARGVVERVVAHYRHTRFCALLRFAPETGWFESLWPRVRVIAVPLERLPFETPDGIEIANADEGEDRGAPFPHVFYYADARDITAAIARLCILLSRHEAVRLVR